VELKKGKEGKTKEVKYAFGKRQGGIRPPWGRKGGWVTKTQRCEEEA